VDGGPRDHLRVAIDCDTEEADAAVEHEIVEGRALAERDRVVALVEVDIDGLGPQHVASVDGIVNREGDRQGARNRSIPSVEQTTLVDAGPRRRDRVTGMAECQQSEGRKCDETNELGHDEESSNSRRARAP
jgi:hypothetical protein